MMAARSSDFGPRVGCTTSSNTVAPFEGSGLGLVALLDHISFQHKTYRFDSEYITRTEIGGPVPGAGDCDAVIDHSTNMILPKISDSTQVTSLPCGKHVCH